MPNFKEAINKRSQNNCLFFEIIESVVRSKAILTLTDDDAEFCIDVEKQKKGYVYGKNAKDIDKLLSFIEESRFLCGIVIRSFTDLLHPITELPAKELRGFAGKSKDGDFIQLSKSLLKESWKELESEVFYIGPEENTVIEQVSHIV